MTGGSFATWSKAPTEVRLLPSPRNWETEALDIYKEMFQKDGSQIREKDISGSESRQKGLPSFQEALHTFQSNEKVLTVLSFRK